MCVLIECVNTWMIDKNYELGQIASYEVETREALARVLFGFQVGVIFKVV